MNSRAKTGYINADEFIAPLSRWVHDSKTAPRHLVCESLTSRGSREAFEL